MTAPDHTARMTALIDVLHAKVQALLLAFADGELNHEQFHTIYDKYHAQLDMAQQALAGGAALLASEAAQGGPPTIAIRETLMGRAVGVVLVDWRHGRVLDMLGRMDVPPSVVAGHVRPVVASLRANGSAERVVVQHNAGSWLLITGGHATVAVTQFVNAPSPAQGRTLERLHRDFETANARALAARSQADGAPLAYPFRVFLPRATHP